MQKILDLKKFEKKDSICKCRFGEIYEVIDKETNTSFRALISDISKIQNINNYTQQINLLSQINHPSILKFEGYTPYDFDNKPNPMIFTENPSKGALANVYKYRSLFDDTKKIIFIFGLSSIMSFLHSNNIIQSALSPENIFIDDSFHPKLGSLGFLAENDELIISMRAVYYSPEYGKHISTQKQVMFMHFQ